MRTSARSSLRPDHVVLLSVSAAAIAALLLIAGAAGLIAQALLVLAFVVPAWLIVDLIRLVAREVPLQYSNHLREERIVNLIEMLSRARRDVVIVSGALFHAIYSDPRVLKAFKQLPRKVRIKVYCTSGGFDPKTQDLQRLLARRGVRPLHIFESNTKHVVIIDCRDVKIEERVADDAEEKIATYYYNDRAIAATLLDEIATLKTAPLQWAHDQAVKTI